MVLPHFTYQNAWLQQLIPAVMIWGMAAIFARRAAPSLACVARQGVLDGSGDDTCSMVEKGFNVGKAMSCTTDMDYCNVFLPPVQIWSIRRWFTSVLLTFITKHGNINQEMFGRMMVDDWFKVLHKKHVGVELPQVRIDPLNENWWLVDGRMMGSSNGFRIVSWFHVAHIHHGNPYQPNSNQ